MAYFNGRRVLFSPRITLVEGTPYEGEYMVTPTKQAQVLETRGKVMSDDLTIGCIPYAAVSNEYGGLTVTIG